MTLSTNASLVQPAPLLNQWQQPVGHPLPQWQPRPVPTRLELQGRYCRLEPICAERHAEALFAAYASAADGSDWTYMTSGPFDSADSYRQYAQQLQQSDDPLHFAVIDLATGHAVGSLALMRIDARNGVIEVGHVALSRSLKRTRVATEAQFLLMQYAFDTLGYRRYEWKCDSLNAPSRRAALRLGFCFEGVFRQAIVYRGRSRDTAWFSIIDGEWPALRMALDAWLGPANFDGSGQQRQSLASMRDRQP